MNLPKNIFIVGIKGVAMANLAVILKKMGKNVAGSDIDEKFITDKILQKNKIKVIAGFSVDDLPKEAEFLICGAAHGGKVNPQVVKATKRGIEVRSQAEVLGELTDLFEHVVAVCGCHGKTTTASLLSYSLIKLGVKPSYLVGTPSFAQYEGGDYHATVHGGYFVIEADEYGVNPPVDRTPKFNYLHPKYIICTNIDFDHPDVYRDIEETKQAFLKFFRGSSNSCAPACRQGRAAPKLLLCIDNANISNLLGRLNRKQYMTYGFSQKADFQIIEQQLENYCSSFVLRINDKGLKINNPKGLKLKFRVGIFGEKNISNCAAVAALLLYQGFLPEQIAKAIAGFTGAKRRFEKIFFKNDIFLFDDYAHHPNEIEATINAARARFPKQRLIIIFQPHTFSRTEILLGDFRKSLAMADLGFILPIFASAREDKKNFKVRSIDIAGGRNNLFYAGSGAQLINQLNKVLKKGDVIFTMGAGDVYQLHSDIIKIIKSKVKSQRSK